MLRIAVHPDRIRLRNGAEQSFSDRWTESLRGAGHEVVSVSSREPGLLDALRTCDGFLWWFPPVAGPRERGKQLAFTLAQTMPKLVVFPDWKSAWHFDDKIAQSTLLEAAGLPMPRTHVFWRLEDALAFLDTATFPLVLKLASGFRSTNVTLLRSRGEAERWVRRIFTRGVSDLSSPLRVWKRRFFRQVSKEPLEKGRVLLQDFVPDNAFDTRVTVIGHRVFAFRRSNRPNDFRASGSGVLLTNPDEIERDALHLAVRAARTLEMPSLAIDVLRRDGQPVLTEISYYYEGIGPRACPGHWIERDGALTWVEGPMRTDDALLEMFLGRLT
jgi:glutathione synthase/RimK-type ligase-like ATP-grasp enzyme